MPQPLSDAERVRFAELALSADEWDEDDPRYEELFNLALIDARTPIVTRISKEALAYLRQKDIRWLN